MIFTKMTFSEDVFWRMSFDEDDLYRRRFCREYFSASRLLVKMSFMRTLSSKDGFWKGRLLEKCLVIKMSFLERCLMADTSYGKGVSWKRYLLAKISFGKDVF